MEMIVWAVAGIAVGWLTYSFLGFNLERGIAVSMAIGAVGALIGGTWVAPLFGAAAASGALNVSGVFFAVVVATACLAVGDILYKRWNV